MLSIPRILEADLGMPSPNLILVAFCALVLASGAAFAWQHEGGMAGMFPPARATLTGLAWAVTAGGCLLALIWWAEVSLLVREAAEPTGARWEADPPEDAAAAFNRMLWGAGFQTLFFTAGAMGVLTKVTKNVWLAVILVAAARMVMALRQMAMAGHFDQLGTVLFVTGLFAATAGLLFARAGLLPAMLLSIVVDLRHFGRLLVSGGDS